MNRRERELHEIVRESGAELVEMWTCGSGHFKTRCRMPDGTVHTVMFPYSPSDHRSLLNKRAFLRRLVRQHTPTKEK